MDHTNGFALKAARRPKGVNDEMANKEKRLLG